LGLGSPQRIAQDRSRRMGSVDLPHNRAAGPRVWAAKAKVLLCAVVLSVGLSFGWSPPVPDTILLPDSLGPLPKACRRRPTRPVRLTPLSAEFMVGSTPPRQFPNAIDRVRSSTRIAADAGEQQARWPAGRVAPPPIGTRSVHVRSRTW
jgi:hypothetical protein